MFDERLTPDYWHYQNFDSAWVGMDIHGGEVTLLTRKGAPQVLYVRYYITWEASPHSGRWFCGPVVAAQVAELNPNNALALLGNLDYYYAGGSYFEGNILETSGPPDMQSGA